ncbi:hypothetical protein B0H66DRAFT_599392 [Apodospora peruviana]|uniref:FAD dependent oxidoreductase domain-containing protein n=1 Tax=Apodospora peruviana TaxID=516989 RepID=A0AAE0MAC6_9PEZI|nr:hypothetical protein B0H66DRAFT_599392 [Apodospora peruviana]
MSSREEQTVTANRPAGAAREDGGVGLPSTNSTKSYWLKDPSPVLSGHRTTEELPQRSSTKGGSVVMLEAREACSGATGRNSGHCQPIICQPSSPIGDFELATFHFLKRFIREHKIPCDWHAASLWPYKLVAWVLEHLLSKFAESGKFNLQKNTPVTSVHPSQEVVSSNNNEQKKKWVVGMPLGEIIARQVLLVTNGYTAHLLPKFGDLIVPVKGQIGALLAPSSPRADGGAVKLDHSYVFLAAANDKLASGGGNRNSRDDCLAQRPYYSSDGEERKGGGGGGGELIFDGGRDFADKFGVGEWRDDSLEEPVAQYLGSSLCPPLDLTSSFPGWTGIMGYSRDQHAWVGSVPEIVGGGGKDGGLYVCAGYSGRGMPAAALSAREVVKQMIGGEDKMELPKGYRLTKELVRIADPLQTSKETFKQLVADVEQKILTDPISEGGK